MVSDLVEGCVQYPSVVDPKLSWCADRVISVSIEVSKPNRSPSSRIPHLTKTRNPEPDPQAQIKHETPNSKLHLRLSAAL